MANMFFGVEPPESATAKGPFDFNFSRARLTIISAAARLTASPFSTICISRFFVCTAYLLFPVIAVN
jgi:hypothetical protein